MLAFYSLWLAPPVSVTIISLNEEEHIAQAIQSVSWADEVIVVDSGSTDKTPEIAASLGARVIKNPWPGYGQQKNFAQSHAKNNWVLNIDADEIVSPELEQEIAERLSNPGHAKGYEFPRKTFYLGRWIKYGGWYPNYLIRLADRRVSRWSEPAVHEQLTVQGDVEKMKSPLLHHAFSSISDQIVTNLNFSKLGSQELSKSGQPASLAKLIFKPIGKFFETYFLKAGYKDGLAGFIISINAAHSMFLKYAYLMESRIKNENPHH